MSDDAKHEIFIVRHRHSDHDDHHGGAWKIAFADFMTAMMAFFLVMWLISANDKTRASVARYFNPVKLVDATTQPRGLHDSKKDDSGITASPDAKEEGGGAKGGKPGAKAGAGQSEGPGSQGSAAQGSAAGKESTTGKESAVGKDKRLDAALRENPYAALAEIVATKGPGDAPVTDGGRDKAPMAIGRRGGDAFRDPFAPPLPSAANANPAGDPERPGTSVQAPNALAPAKVSPERGRPNVAPFAPAGEARDALAGRERAGRDGDGVGSAAADQVMAERVASDRMAADKAPTDKVVADKVVADKIAAAANGGPRDVPGPKVDVRRTGEGLLVSLTDTANFAMFPNGSAVPDRRVVLLMEKVAQILKGRPGVAILRGYTDNKPYKSGRYDNWHLSLDRAQVAHYMLVRGGFSEARIGHVEGYADHGERPGIDPASPANRRIEILLKDVAP